jgi:hypothetical protein
MDVSSKFLPDATDSNHKAVTETTLIDELAYTQIKAIDSEISQNTPRFMKVTSCIKSECSRPFLALEFAEPERCETNCEGIKEDPPIRMKSRPHPHSHGTRSVTIVLAIAFHAIIEGLALGVQVSFCIIISSPSRILGRSTQNMGHIHLLDSPQAYCCLFGWTSASPYSCTQY